MTDRELMQMALDALEYLATQTRSVYSAEKAIEALRARLAQSEPEPVAWLYEGDDVYGKDVCLNEDIFEEQKPNCTPLYTAPPQREWQGLTENEIKHLWYEACQTNLELTSQLIVHLARNIEAKLKEKNNG